MRDMNSDKPRLDTYNDLNHAKRGMSLHFVDPHSDPDLEEVDRVKTTSIV